MTGRRALQTAASSLLCSVVLLFLARYSDAIQNCSQTVRVDQSAPDDGGNFPDLQDALLSLSRRETASNDCISVLVAEGEYVITDFINISQNMSLQGENVTVRFNFTGKFDPRTTTRPHYLLSFINANYVRLSGLDFIDSPGIITIFNVTSAIVENCSFRYFFQGALDLYNCDFIQVTGSVFEHNGPTSVIKEDQYRGHAGGLSIGYHLTPTPPVAVISGCLFRNNTSDPSSDLVQTTSDLVRSSQFTGRGGGCAFPVNPLYSLNATVKDCTFEDNFANSFGGGLYVAFNGKEHNTVILRRVVFLRNRAPTAGALEVGFVSGGNPGAQNGLLAYDSVFIENQATFGGGVYFFTLGPSVDSEGRLGNFASFENCTFIRNRAEEVGAAIGVSTLLYFRDLSNVTPFQITSCTFSLNDAGGGGVMSSAYFPLAFSGNTVFEENRGRTLVVVASRVNVNGSIEFVENNGAGIDGGALYLTSLSQMVLSPGANLTFERNMGVLGAAVVGDTLFVPSVVSQLPYNPLCMVRYIDSLLPPNEWENVSISFAGNQALTSSAVLVINLDLCSYVRQGFPWFNASQTFRWDFVNFSNNNENSAHKPDEFNPEWYIQTPADRITVTTVNNTAYPGEVFELGLEALDEINQRTAAVIRISDSDDQGEYVFDPAVITFDSIALGAVNTSFYRLRGVLFADNNLTVNLLLGEPSETGAFSMTSLECPPGYILDQAPLESAYETCSCNSNNDLIIQCKGRSILIETGYWGTLSTTSKDRLFLYPCPSGYCRCAMRDSGRGDIDCINTFNTTDPDSQCSCDRKGELCGECRDGKGVSAILNRCTTCSDASGLLILLLMVLDVGVFVFLLVVMKPFPTWIYPFVFYLQILPYLAEDFPITFDKVHPYLYYISSALSFYFIYDFCLYSDMSPLVSYFLRYLPLILLSITATVVLSIRRYLKKHALSWHGLWWIVLLMYTHILHSSMSILNCPVLPGRDGSDVHVPRWYIDGTVKCFNGAHAPLGMLAIIVLATCVAIIPLSLVYITATIHRPWVFRRSFEPLVIPFKEELKWWSSVELGRRIIIVLFIVSFPHNQYPTIFVLMITAALYGYIQPFKDLAVNILETALSINTLVLLLLRNTDTVEESLGHLGEQSAADSQTNVCRDSVDGVTDLAWLLLPLYYLPLAVFCITGVVWISLRVRQYYYKRLGTGDEKSQEDNPPVAQTHTTTDIYLEAEASASVVVMSYQRN